VLLGIIIPASRTSTISHINSSVLTLVLALPFTAANVSIISWFACVVIPVGCVNEPIIGAEFFKDIFGNVILSFGKVPAPLV